MNGQPAASCAHCLRVAVVGASIGGLSVANVLHQLGAQVHVFELFPLGFASRGGALGFVDSDVLRRIRPAAAAAARAHGNFYGNLWQFLFDGLPPGTVHFGVHVTQIVNSSSAVPRVALPGGEEREFDLVIGADGGASAVRPYVTQHQPSYSGYVLWRGLVPSSAVQQLVPSVQRRVSPITWGYTTIAGAVYSNGGFPFVGAHADSFMQCGVYMPMPVAEVPTPSRNRQLGDADAPRTREPLPDWWLPLVIKLFGSQSSNTAYWSAVVQHGKITCHPVWELHGLDRVVAGRIALLGDAAHMASPRTGAGAYSAMLDALVMQAALTTCNTLEQALLQYNAETLKRGQELHEQGQWGAERHTRKDGISVSPRELLHAQWNFAYGANVSPQKLLERGISPLESLPCVLDGYRLAFNHFGGSRFCDCNDIAVLVPLKLRARAGMGNLVPDAGCSVHGVAHLMSCEDFDSLCLMENDYSSTAAHVRAYDVSRAAISCMIVVGKPSHAIKAGLPPTSRYLNLLITGGARWLGAAQPHPTRFLMFCRRALAAAAGVAAAAARLGHNRGFSKRPRVFQTRCHRAGNHTHLDS